ncbi:MAG: hypothetical protein ACLUEQ_11925 [Cloacibacillus evryensis]
MIYTSEQTPDGGSPLRGLSRHNHRGASSADIIAWLKSVSEDVAMARRAVAVGFLLGLDRPGAQSSAFEWVHEKLPPYLPRLKNLFARTGPGGGLHTLL